jgi:hypothetical protein
MKCVINVGWVLVGTLAIALGGCASAPEYCNDTSSSGFRTWVNESWTSYCEQLSARLEEPASYELRDLTVFFSRHPERSGELRQRLATYKEPNMCFQGADEFKYRALTDCLKTDEEMAQRVQTAWTTQATPWIDELNYRNKRVTQALSELNAIREKTEKELREKTERRLVIERPIFDQFNSALAKVEKDIEYIEANVRLYDELRSLSAGYSPLAQIVNDGMRPQVDPVVAQHAKNVAQVEKLRVDRAYYGYATNAIGKPCPANPNPRASKEAKQAAITLAEQLAQIQANPRLVRISEPLVREKNAETRADFEYFSGFVCGARQPEHQFVDRPVLCGQYTFTLERARSPDRDWEPWIVKDFVEMGPEGGVDCAMIK